MSKRATPALRTNEEESWTRFQHWNVVYSLGTEAGYPIGSSVFRAAFLIENVLTLSQNTEPASLVSPVDSFSFSMLYLNKTFLSSSTSSMCIFFDLFDEEAVILNDKLSQVSQVMSTITNSRTTDAQCLRIDQTECCTKIAGLSQRAFAIDGRPRLNTGSDIV